MHKLNAKKYRSSFVIFDIDIVSRRLSVAMDCKDWKLIET